MLFFIIVLTLVWAGLLSTAFFYTALLAMLAYYLLYAIGAYKTFQKANVPGILAFIPIVHEYELYKISCGKALFFVGYAIAIVHSCLQGNETIPSILVSLLGVISIFIEYTMGIKLAKSFGKGFFFGLLVVLFEPIALIILGFGNSDYLGPQA